MDEIRMEKNDEKLVIKARFKYPAIIVACFVVLLIVTLVFGVICLILKESMLPIFSCIPIYIICLVFIIHANRYRNCMLVVTNRRIYGTSIDGVKKNASSHRLDTIDDVRLSTTALGHGDNKLIVVFSKGNDRGSSQQVLTFQYVKNGKEVYEALSKYIASIKTDKNLHTDIEMKRIGAQEIQAKAFEKIATGITNPQNKLKSNQNNMSYIEEIKNLKGLLDDGIIAEEEFEQKKLQLLK